jgi:hypothetical protein
MRLDERGPVDRPSANSQAQDVIVNLIAESVVRTYGVQKKMIIYNPELNNYRAFVMLKITKEDVKAMADLYDQSKQVKLQGRVGGKSLDETATEVLQQTQR